MEILSEIKNLTKGTLLHKLILKFNTLDVIPPTNKIGNMIYCDVCDSKNSVDEVLPHWILKKWEKWVKKVPTKVIIPRAVNLVQEVYETVDIHVFGDASLLGTCAVAYVVIPKPSGIKQELITSKSRLSKKYSKTPRPVLVHNIY